MNPSEYRIPEEKTQEVFTLAAQLYAKHNQSYTVKELMEAGAEAKIPPEFIQQAIDQLQIQWSPASPLGSTNKTKRSKGLLLGLAIGLPALLALGVAGWLFSRNANTVAVTAPTGETVEPIPNQPQVSDANLGGVPFKCEGLNLEGQDLRQENFRNADCKGAKLAGADLRGVNIENANLSGADLRNAKLSDANLKNANLTEANLAEATLSEANLENVNLSKADLSNANLSNANLRQTNLAEADLEDATLDVRRAKAERVNFNNATMPDGTKHP